MQGENYQVDMTPLASIPIEVPQDLAKFNELHDKLCSLNNRLKTETKKFDRTIGVAYGVNALPRAAAMADGVI